MTAVHWKLTIAWAGGAREKSRQRKGTPPPAQKGALQANVMRNWAAANGAAGRLCGVPEAHVLTAGAGRGSGAPDGEALHFHAHETEQFPQPLAPGLKFREQQFADVGAVGATNVRVTRLAQRFSYGLLRSRLRHDQLPT
jgi:hypothetical protein